MLNPIEVAYGNSIIERQLGRLGPYIVITMEPAWAIAEPFFRSVPPVSVIQVDTLDQDKLDDLFDRLVSGVLKPGLQIAGVGGGTVIDAAKYFAYRLDTVPLLIPTITSTNAPFSDYISIRRNGGPFGFKVDGYPKKVLVDTGLIGLAEPRFNRAGYGDLLYMQTALNDWKLMSARGVGAAWNDKVGSCVAGLMSETMQQAAEIGSMTEAGIRRLMELTQRSTETANRHPTLPIGAGSEHLFAWTVELTAAAPPVHGEIVSLGIIISSFLQAEHLADSRCGELRQALDDARVRYVPEDIGVTWEEVEAALRSVDSYNRRVRGYHTVFDLTEWSRDRLLRLKEYVYAGNGLVE